MQMRCKTNVEHCGKAQTYTSTVLAYQPSAMTTSGCIPLSYHNSAGLLSTVKIKVSLPTLMGQTEKLISEC